MSGKVDKLIALAPIAFFAHSDEKVLRDLSEMHMPMNVATDMGFLEFNDGYSVDDNSIQRIFKRNYFVICYVYPMLCSEEPASLESYDALESVDVSRLHPS